MNLARCEFPHRLFAAKLLYNCVITKYLSKVKILQSRCRVSDPVRIRMCRTTRFLAELRRVFTEQTSLEWLTRFVKVQRVGITDT